MSDSPTGDRPEPPADESPGVLASLPHTRPQRASARRAAARAGKAGPARAPGSRTGNETRRDARVPGSSTARKAEGSRPTASARPARRRATGSDAGREQVPRQGYEAEPDSLAGPVQPPGSAELVTSASELAGELARAGVTAGARLVKDLLSRLPG